VVHSRDDKGVGVAHKIISHKNLAHKIISHKNPVSIFPDDDKAVLVR